MRGRRERGRVYDTHLRDRDNPQTAEIMIDSTWVIRPG